MHSRRPRRQSSARPLTLSSSWQPAWRQSVAQTRQERARATACPLLVVVEVWGWWRCCCCWHGLLGWSPGPCPTLHSRRRPAAHTARPPAVTTAGQRQRHWCWCGGRAEGGAAHPCARAERVSAPRAVLFCFGQEVGRARSGAPCCPPCVHACHACSPAACSAWMLKRPVRTPHPPHPHL